MSKQLKKALIIAGLVLDFAVTAFLFVVSIILIIKTSQTKDWWDMQNAHGLIGYFQKNPNVYLGTCVIPLFVLLALNIILLVVYVKNSEKKKEVKVADLSPEQKEALKKQLMEELNKK